jgi:two-component system CheB/CheR fusion protein
MEQGDSIDQDVPFVPSQVPAEASPQDLPRHGGLLHLVGIGASAGGLEALQVFVGSLKAGGKVAYVVAQHLSPDHRSLIVDLLARSTALEVLSAVDGAVLRPDTITVAPSNHDMAVVKDRLVVMAPTPRFGPSPSVDLLFESIAEHWGDRGVAVVLSGTGSDGARGLRAVRAAGGLTVAQTPESARFDGMPSAAISLGGADLVLDPATIAQRLNDLMVSGGDWVGSSLPDPEPVNLCTVMGQLKHATGIDFSQYKGSTLRRQVQRRMAIRQLDDIEDYLQLLAGDTAEAHSLVQNLLVTVTSFFRDPEAFQALSELLRAYLAQRTRKDQLRVWVPGCATGEEVYSLAMVISDVLGHPLDLSSHLKIFGTDLDEESLLLARRATYPASAAAAIPEALLDRFVIRTNGDIEISESLRNCVVFARHNVGEDPPFPRLDLISCRNTLIYFTPPLQERVFNLFRFGLQPSGLLFLGSSESLGNRTPGFGVADAEHRVFFRTAEPYPPRGASFVPSSLRPSVPISPLGRVSILRETLPEQHVATLEALVRSSVPPCVVLDEHHELVEVIGEVGPYCRLPEGRITSSATTFLLPELQAESRALFLMVRADGQPVRSRVMNLPEHDGGVRLEARPLRIHDRVLTVLSFVKEKGVASRPESAEAPSERDGDFDREIERLEKELLSSQDSLRRSLADLEGANEELEASSEELQASSEELQSSNEELESSNEELQATNEELATLNQQLRSRGEELQQITTDLENIQRSLNQGMVIVDRELRVTRYTPLAVRVFALVQADIGQSLLGVPTTVPLPGLREALGDVIDGAPHRNLEALSEEVSYLAQVLPYQEVEGQRRGAIVTLTDVSELVGLRRAAEAALGEFASLTNALEEAVWKRDASMQHLVYASRRFQALTGWTPAELCDQPSRLDQAIDPEDRERVRASRDLSLGAWTVQYRLHTRDGRWIWVQESAQVLQEDEDRFVVGTLSDVTGHRRIETHARDLSILFETLVRTSSFALLVLDETFRIVMVNNALVALLGFDRDSLIGSPASLVCDLPEEVTRLVAAPSADSEPPTLRSLSLRHRDGTSLLMQAEIRRLPAPMESGALLLLLRDQSPTEAKAVAQL